MTFRRTRWNKVAGSVEELIFGPNAIATATFNNKSICVARSDDKLYAFEYYCPHAGGIMAQGCLTKKGYVVCPVHDISFDMKSGENVSGEGFQLQTWRVKETSRGIFVGVKEVASFWELFTK